jgi:hypothetical protein
VYLRLSFTYYNCTENFATELQLKKHSKKHKTHICKECLKVFASPKGLREHVNREHKGMKWGCDRESCSYTTGSRNNLPRHKRNNHGV